jgi:hypothetical protein
MSVSTGARVRRERSIAVLLLAWAVGCGSEPVAPGPPALPILPGSTLPGYTVRTESLDAPTIAAEVADPSSVEPVLEEMEAGTERRFSSRRSPEQQVITRAIRFASGNGAAGYVAWLDGHAADVLGPGPHDESVAVDGAVAFSHDPEGCCPGKEMVWWLVAWSRGTDAFVLMVGGTQVRSDVVERVAAAMDQEAGGA